MPPTWLRAWRACVPAAAAAREHAPRPSIERLLAGHQSRRSTAAACRAARLARAAAGGCRRHWPQPGLSHYCPQRSCLIVAAHLTGLASPAGSQAGVPTAPRGPAAHYSQDRLLYRLSEENGALPWLLGCMDGVVRLQGRQARGGPVVPGGGHGRITHGLPMVSEHILCTPLASL